MKRLAVFLGAVMLICSCAQDGYVIKGDIEGLEGTLFLIDAYEHTINETECVDGKFTFRGKVDHPILAYIDNGPGQETPIDAPILLENARLKVRGDVETWDISITGSKSNENMTEYIRRRKQMEYGSKEFFDMVKETFRENTDNYLGAMLISSLYLCLDDEEFVSSCEMLPTYLKQEKIVYYYEDIAKARLNTSVGRPFTEIVLSDSEGNPCPLSGAVDTNELTLLVIWASWGRDAESRLKDIMDMCAAYKDKGLGVFSVCMDSNLDKWRACSKAAGVFGVNLCDDYNKTNEAAKPYGFDSLPGLVVIDRAGTIVARGREAADVAESIEGHFQK